ncbi:MAG TPA: hypothetical protein VMN58_08640 [Acidimicrobiales bacterium]|nr:hypothetical protein [Acidimicrobiales bacterium]
MAERPEVRSFYLRCSTYFGDHPTGADAHQLIDMIESDDVDVALFGIGLIHMWVNDQEMTRVFEARHARRSWGWIGARLGRTRQAVWERYRDRTEGTPEG